MRAKVTYDGTLFGEFEWSASSCPVFLEFTAPPDILIMEGLIR